MRPPPWQMAPTEKRVIEVQVKVSGEKSIPKISNLLPFDEVRVASNLSVSMLGKEREEK